MPLHDTLVAPEVEDNLILTTAFLHFSHLLPIPEPSHEEKRKRKRKKKNKHEWPSHIPR